MNPFLICWLVLAVFLGAMEVETMVISAFDAGSCDCGVFRMEPEATEPILHRRLPLAVPCDHKGAEMCQGLCVNLAEAAGSNGVEVLCASLMDVHRLIVGIKTKSCGLDAWVFAGLTSESICCVDGKSIDCQ